MNIQKYKLLLADDDEDDCAFFKDALDELLVSVSLTTVNDGVKLMKYLTGRPTSFLPDIVFLDLNMPKKNGVECLTEIKQIDSLKHLPVIVLSTSFDNNMVDYTYEKGAMYYIQKPSEFTKLKKVIGDSLVIASENKYKQPMKEFFILKP